MPHVKHPKNQNALLLSEILPLSENFGLVPTTIFNKEGRWHCRRFFPCCEELARWICNEEEIAEVSVLEWQSLLKKRRGDTWAVSSLYVCSSSWSFNIWYLKKNGCQWPDFALSDADPNLVLFHGVCACIPECRIWSCEGFYPQMQVMIHTQRKGRMQIPCREATASHVNKEPSGCATASPLELLFPWCTRCCKICFLQGKKLFLLMHYPVWWWTVLRLVPHCMGHIQQVPLAQPFSDLMMIAHILQLPNKEKPKWFF